jgi:hypothetical protein
MTKKPDALEGEHPARLTQDTMMHREEIREDLLRLRRLGEKLPTVDAAAIVRESRDTTAQGKR